LNKQLFVKDINFTRDAFKNFLLNFLNMLPNKLYKIEFASEEIINLISFKTSLKIKSFINTFKTTKNEVLSY
jgi:hypothetical protein